MTVHLPPRARAVAITVLLLPALCLVGCGGSAEPGPEPSPAVPPRSSEPDLQDLERLYHARLAAERENVSPADVDFMTGMISHHAQALVMSRLAPDNGASPAILTLTARIINAQTDEIALMQRWLRERDRPVPEVNPDGTMPMAHAMGHHHLMPGMLTDAQLAELAAARGPVYDRLFLTYMIQHHEGAVGMVHDLFAIDGAAQDDAVFKIASDIQVDQITEINRMRRMLDALPPGS